MKLLLDTHAFLWLNDESERLSQAVKDLCSSGEHEFYLSMVSPWEMQIKHQLGKLSLALPSAEMSRLGVAERAAMGGHDISLEDVMRRFPRIAQSVECVCA